MSRLHWLIAVVFAGGVAACSNVPYAQHQQQREAAYIAAAGAPVQHFRFMSLWSWEPLSDNQVVIYTRPNQGWLLDLDGPCQNLQYTDAIGLTSSLGEVSTRFDKVLTGRRYFPCTIQQIRPVDVARLKIERQAQRKIDSQPRNQALPAGR